LITRRDDKIIIREVYKDFPADKAGLNQGWNHPNRRCTFIRLQRRCIPTDERGKHENWCEIPAGVKYSPNHSWWSRNKIGCIFLENRCKIVLAHLIKKASYETKQALEELKRQGERIILDLRGNPEACSTKR
jgi:carboxyl-terminal processing protease